MFNSTAILMAGAFLAAALEWWAVWRGAKRLEYFAKPSVMIALFAWLVAAGGLGGALSWFGMGVLFSLAGDVFLMLAEGWFVPGLVAFLFAHVAYIVGFNLTAPAVAPLWGLGLAIVLGLSAARLLRRIIIGLRRRGRSRLALPVLIYGMVITLMLLSALLTLFRPDWESTPALLVSLGAALFYFSDIILAFNKFVAPIKNGRLLNIALYHLGQIALIVGVVLQFS